MWEWIYTNKEWVFSGVGASILVPLLTFMFKNKESKNIGDQKQEQVVTQNNNQNVVVNVGQSPLTTKMEKTISQDDIKNITKILFIDDDTHFDIVKIIKNAGWKNTKMVADVSNLDDDQIKSADIFFIDINGVGIKLKFPDEGLGLAKALGEKYPTKKRVIYSAENQTLHPVLNEVDWILKKDATPYEFLHVIDELSK